VAAKMGTRGASGRRAGFRSSVQDRQVTTLCARVELSAAAFTAWFRAPVSMECANPCNSKAPANVSSCAMATARRGRLNQIWRGGIDIERSSYPHKSYGVLPAEYAAVVTEFMRIIGEGSGCHRCTGLISRSAMTARFVRASQP